MTLVPLEALPGICKVDSDLAAGKEMGSYNGRQTVSRYRDGNNVRFVAGLPEKIGGWSAALSSLMSGVPRGMKDWRDSTQNIRMAIGTHLKLYYYGQSATSFTDITPYRGILTGNLSNPLTTTLGSKVVTVAHTAHGLVTGDYVQLVSSAAVGGITVSGVFNPITKVDANTYTVTFTSAATGAVSGGGGTVAYTYYRVTLSGPFTTTSGSPVVTVAHTAHGAIANDYVTISGASAVGGLTLSGEYQIMNVATNSYQVTAGSNASSSATGGGSPTLQYDINSGNVDTAQTFGYGLGVYSGAEGYSQPPTTGILLAARTWSIAPYGQQILVNPSGGGIYVWDPTIAGRAYPLFNAPTTCLALFVTTERFVIALGVTGFGGTGTATTLAWPDQSDDTNWTSLPTNTANSGRTLQGGSYFVGGLAVRDGVNLISTNTKVFSLTYTGDNNVYANTAQGDADGFIGPLAACEISGVVYWMGNSDFYMWNGAVQALPSDDIRDYVFDDINLAQAAKFLCYPINQKKVIRFAYCSSASTEINRCIEFHVDQGCWSIHSLPFTCAVDQALFPTPMACDATGALYDLETGHDANGAALDASLTYAPVMLGNGDRAFDVMGFIMDAQRQSGNLTVSVLSRTYPNDADTVDGPYTVAASDGTPRIDTRSNGKLVGYKIESNVMGGDFRLGIPQADISPAGARR